jgi:arylsulfatase A-like enzyme
VGPTLLDADAGTGSSGDAAAGSALDAAPEAAPPPPEPLTDPREGFDVRLDLADHLHLADVEHQGLFIQFGTPARNKYTLGNWRTGWDRDDVEDGRPFTWVGGSPTRMYLHLDRPSQLRIGFRARPNRSDRFSLYVNDHAIERLDLPSGWSEQWLTVDAAHTIAGENAIKLIHQTTSGARAFALEWMRIVAGPEAPATGEGFAAPTLAALRRRVTIDDRELPALVLRAPGRLSWFLELPPAATLGFSLGLTAGEAAAARVRVTDAIDGEPHEVYQADLTAAPAWRNGQIDLAGSGGRVVRIDLEVEARGEGSELPTVAFATPSIMSRPARITAAPSEQPRHVIVLLIDTLRADKLTAYGRTRVVTPEMDRFASQSVLFERCQTPANWTKPACASVLTGLHPPTHGALTESGVLPASATMCSELFQREGFRTAALIANGYLASDFGFNRGWHFYRNFIRERRATEAEHVYADTLTWIEQNREERMFLYVQTIDPHVPYDPPESDLRRYDPDPYSGPVRNRSTGLMLDDFKAGRVTFTERDLQRLEALYDGEVTYHDRHFGRFLTRLEEMGLLDNTLFLVTADHGEEFWEHESLGHGHSLNQELLHVPLLLRWPGVATPGQRLGQTCSLVDVAPTILDAAGLAVPEEMEGRSLITDLRGAPPPMTSAAFSSQWDTGNDRELSWTARVGDWKLRMRGPAISYLYNLSDDPREATDLDSRRPIALRAARIALGQFLGASSRRHWAAATPPRGRPRPGAPPRAEEAEMTPELCEQLRALGYMDACE